MTCNHENTAAHVDVRQYTTAGKTLYTRATLKIWCADCGRKFQFKGIKAFGTSNDVPTCSLDGLELTLPIAEEGTAPTPLTMLQTRQ